MRKRNVILLVGALVFSAMLTGCGSADKKEETTNRKVKETTTVQSGENNAEPNKETADKKTNEKADAESDESNSVTSKKTDDEQKDGNDTEAETRTDGSTISGNTYHDAIYGFTMTLPDGWKDGVYMNNTNGEEGRTLKFVEKTNFDSDRNLGWIFTISASEEEVDENSNNERSLGSIVDQEGNRIYIICTTPSDVQCDITDESLMENYRAVFEKKDEAINSIIFDADRDYKTSEN